MPAIYSCHIESIELVTPDIYCVVLTPTEPVTFEAGQFLELLVPDMSDCYFTIASSPNETKLEIHIQHQGDDSRSSEIIEFLKSNQTIDVRAAMGHCVLSQLPDEEGPLLFVVAGTGFSQAKSIIESLIYSQASRPVHLYWGSATVSGLYMAQLPEQWHKEHHNIHFSAVVSEQNEWMDRQDLLFNAIQSDNIDLSNSQAVCCGSPTMVYAILDELTAQGFRKDQMISDVFEFSPR